MLISLQGAGPKVNQPAIKSHIIIDHAYASGHKLGHFVQARIIKVNTAVLTNYHSDIISPQLLFPYRWVERILSVRQTCRIRSKRTFPVLVDAMNAFFKEQTPDLAWISQG